METEKTIKPKVKRSFLSKTPSFVLAILTFIGATILLFAIGEGLGSEGSGILKGSVAEALSYIIAGLVIAVCCFFIVRENPGSMWYVPIICNLLGILSAVSEQGFWTTASWWGIVCGGWVLSIGASIMGARMGKQKAR